MSAYSVAVLAETSLVHYYPMSEASGTTATDAKGVLNGTIQSGVTVNQTAIFGSEGPSYSFDGTSNAYVSFSSNWGGDANWTYEKIAYLTVDNLSLWVNGNYGNTSALKLIMRTTVPDFDLSSWVGADRLFPATIGLNTAYHVALAFDGTTKTLYVNGASVATNVGASDTPAGAIAYIGCGAIFGGTRNGFWNGRISNMAYYNADIGATAVAAHYALLSGGGGGGAKSQVVIC